MICQGKDGLDAGMAMGIDPCRSPTKMYVMPGLLLNNSPSGGKQLVPTPTPNHTSIANQNLPAARPTTVCLAAA